MWGGTDRDTGDAVAAVARCRRGFTVASRKKLTVKPIYSRSSREGPPLNHALYAVCVCATWRLIRRGRRS